MAKTKGKKSRSRTKKENRIPKILGVLFGFLALYLTIAFLSYLFTWKADQDQVLKLSWSILWDNSVQVTNWLGRLGAVVSNLFFYWGFGIGAFLLIPIFIRIGTSLIKKLPLLHSLEFFQRTFIGMCFVSIVSSFLFQQSSFSWGGSFGTNICFWLTNFVGQVGLSIMLIFAVLSWLIWKFNPSLDALVIALPGGGVSMTEKFQLNWKGWSNQSAQSRSPKKTKEKQPTTTLRPRSVEDTFLFDDITDAVPKTDLTSNPSSEVQERSSHLELELPETMIGEPSEKKASPFEKIKLKDFGIAPKKNQQDIENRILESALEIAPKGEKINQELVVEEENDEDNDQPFDPTLELSKYKTPSFELLDDYADQQVEIDRDELEANKDQIIRSLLNFKIEITKIRATIGPTVTLYEIVPAPGVKISKIKNLEDDIALSLSALGIRIIAPIPGKGTIGIEVPNKKKQIVSFKEVIRSEKFQNAKMDLPLALGKTISNEVFVADLAKMPHLLIAGATGQGKSVGINAIISSILYKKHPSQVKLVLIDPKKVELFPYSQINKHFLAYLPNEEEPIVTETSKVVYTLNSLCIEMDERYDLLKQARARNIKEYNDKFIARKLNPRNGHKFMPYIVLVIDEFADLIMTAGKEIELPIARIAQLARAVGIHLIIATQRPSVNIITGVIKANFPARIAFKVTSKIDSRTILDSGGADQLIGRGDMLLSVGGNIVRLQCAFVDTPEVERVVDYIGNQQGYPEPFYLPEFVTDDSDNNAKSISITDLDSQFWDAAALVVSNQHGSTSMLQRKLQLGYNRAGRIMDQLEALGIVGEAQGSKPREVLYFSESELVHLREKLLNGSI